MRSDHPAFTLVELLVVITIIVILTSVLVPSVEKAIYRAKLVSCGSQLKLIANGVTSYTLDHKNWYPYRPVRGPNGSGLLLVDMVRNNRDDRMAILPYMPIKAFVDPLIVPVDLSIGAQFQWIQSSQYTPWWGVQYAKANAQAPEEDALFRGGDRFSFTDGSQGSSQRTSYNVLVGDSDVITNHGEGRYLGSHPDSKGLMRPRVFDRTVWGFGVWLTASYWDVLVTNGAKRGTVDHSYAFTDNSVTLYDGVVPPDDYDERMGSVPIIHNNANWPNWRQQLPR